ncbi:MAG: hypothetical protein NW223_02200 [Hyphomicrobiaceae bacterium]|nr:hypothetical protein [Hyphomicrobiaceae bacterium]
MQSFLAWPPGAVVALCIACAFTPALLLWTIAAVWSRKGRLAGFAGVEPAIIGSVGLLFGLFAAFLANDIWTRNQIARQAVIEEADAVRNLARLAEGSAEIAREMRTLLVDYTNVVIQSDWPLMTQGKRSLDVLARVRTISNLIVAGSVAGAVGPVVQGKMLDAFVQLREKRQARVIMAENRKLTIKWHALIVFGLLTQLAITISHLVKPRPMLLAHVVFASALAACLSILILNEFPFSPLNPISPEPFETARNSLFRQ